MADSGHKFGVISRLFFSSSALLDTKTSKMYSSMLKLLSVAILLSASPIAGGQSTFIYDQQASDESRVLEGGTGIGIAAQSFTPTLSQVGFVRLHVYDGVFDGNGGGILFVTLRSQSASGPALGQARRS